MKNKISFTSYIILAIFYIILLIKYINVKSELTELKQSNIVRIYEDYSDNDTIPVIWFGYNGHDYISSHDPDCWCQNN